LQEELSVTFDEDEVVYLSEKIDGANGRIIFLPDGSYLIGSREDLLYFRGDVLHNPALNIVEALRPIAEHLEQFPDFKLHELTVCYFEIYGAKCSKASKQYTQGNQLGARLFDIQTIRDYQSKLEAEIEEIASWRDSSQGEWMPSWRLFEWAENRDIKAVPDIDSCQGSAIPKTIQGAKNLLDDFAFCTQAQIDGEPGKAEGLILRTKDRRKIVKLRHEDYDRTLKR
jgi:hypothetical protein